MFRLNEFFLEKVNSKLRVKEKNKVLYRLKIGRSADKKSSIHET